MSATRRNVLAAAGASLALPQIARAASAPAAAPEDSNNGETVAKLIRLSEEGNAALMRGEVDRYRALIPITEDYTLMAPFGGAPTHGSTMTDERWESIGRFFRNGTFEQEVVQAYGSADIVVLATIERCNVEAGGLPAQEWPLRVTLVYRREGGEWRLAHRHADPLAKGITIEQAAELARGEAA